VAFSGRENFASDGISVLTGPIDPRFNDIPLEAWYYSKFGEDIDKAPFYYRMYYETYGAYDSDFQVPTDPDYLHFLLTEGLVEVMNNNRRKGDDDIYKGSAKHVSIRVKESPIVPLHVPNTVVTSSVKIRDEQAPHLINVTSWWMGDKEKENKDDDPHYGGTTKE